MLLNCFSTDCIIFEPPPLQKAVISWQLMSPAALYFHAAGGPLTGHFCTSLDPLMQQEAEDPARVAASPTICQLSRSVSLQAALEPQVAGLVAVTWRCMGTKPSVTVRLQGPILYMVSTTGLNKGSHN